jgi:hypothetical protein
MGGSGDLNPSTNTVLKEQGVHDRPGAKTLMAQLARWLDGSRITMKSSQGVEGEVAQTIHPQPLLTASCPV